MKLGLVLECDTGGPDELVLTCLTRRLDPEVEVQAEALGSKSQVFLKGAETASMLIEASRCDLVLIVWDLKPYWDPARGRSCEDETQEMLNTLAFLPAATRRKVRLLCLTWEIETWLIADHRAVREHLSTDAHREKKFRCSNPLGKADAKAFMIGEFRKVRGKSGRYVDYREAIQIARLMPDTRQLQGIPSFTRFARLVSGKTNADFQLCGDACNDLVYQAQQLGRR